MALQVSYNYRGLLVPAAYIRLLHYRVDKDDSYAAFTVAVYADRLVRLAAPKIYLDAQNFLVRDQPVILRPDGTVVTPAITAFTDLFSDASLRLSDQSPERSCYVYLKTQRGFQNGVDV